MRKVIISAAFILMVIIGSCEKWQEYPCDNIHTERTGARCNDGTRSNSTGSGACSGHGGVNYWLCN